MTIDHPKLADTQIREAGSTVQPNPLPDESVAGLLAAGAMTALLSGDVRLAVRATRVLIGDRKTDARDSAAKDPHRGRRVWRRPQPSRSRGGARQ
jgi:hypothetical protein